MIRSAPWLVCALVLLAGCVHASARLTLSQEGTVSGNVVVAVDEHVVELGGMTADEFTTLLTTRDGGPPDGSMGLPLRLAEAEPYSESGFVGARYRFADVDADEFRQPAGGARQVFTQQDDGSWQFEARLLERTPFTDFDNLTGLDLRGDLVVTVTFPYAVETHNGVLERPNVVTWSLDLTDRAPTLRATTGHGAGPGARRRRAAVGRGGGRCGRAADPRDARRPVVVDRPPPAAEATAVGGLCPTAARKRGRHGRGPAGPGG